MQQILYEKQSRLLMKMEFEIKKKYSMSKRNVYGIENEQ